MKKLFIRNSNGDTIVEVMIVLAILSLAFAISYATANRGLIQSRNSEEHSQALELLSSQIELLRTAVQNRATLPTNSFCITDPSNPSTSFGNLGESIINITPAADSAGGYSEYSTAGCQSSNSLYNESITSEPGYYIATVRWDGLGTLGPQQAQLTYRVNQLAASSSSGVPLTTGTPTVTVTVKEIPPTQTLPSVTDPTPNCSDAATADHSGSSVTLKDLDNGSTQSSTTDTSSTSVFQNGLINDGNYNASVSAPSGFVSCSPTSSGNFQLNAGNDFSKTFATTIYPQCYQEPTVIDLGSYGDPLGSYGDPIGDYGDPIGYYGDPIGDYGDPIGYYSDYLGQEYKWVDVGPYPSSSAQRPLINPANNTGTYYYPAGTTSGSLGETPYPAGIYAYDYSETLESEIFYERYEAEDTGAYYGAAYEHYGTPYEHYSAPYEHYGTPYEHYTAPYEHYTAPYEHYDTENRYYCSS